MGDMTFPHPARDAGSQALVDRFNKIGDSLPGRDIGWLRSRRLSGAESFAATGWPGPKTEAWRFTPLRALQATEFDWTGEGETDVAKDSLPALVFGREASCRVVLVNGRFRRDLSTLSALPDGVALYGFREALEAIPDVLDAYLGQVPAVDETPLMALNQAFMDDGFVLHVPKGVALEQSVEVLSVGTGGALPPVYHPRNLILVEAGARATVIEHHVGLCIGGYFANVGTEIVVGQNAILRHCKVQDEAKQAFHIATTRAVLDRDALYDSFVFTLGGRLSRNEVHVTLKEPGADCRLNGAYLLKGEQHADHTTLIDHAAAHTTSKELFKGVLADTSRGVFQGKIIVRPGAQKADGQQMNRALLLSPGAEIDSKPELEIYADDVKCSHGATAGQIDETALFYLRSRGVPESLARRLLVEAFLAEVIDGIALTGMRLPLQENVARWMGR